MSISSAKIVVIATESSPENLRFSSRSKYVKSGFDDIDIWLNSDSKEEFIPITETAGRALPESADTAPLWIKPI